MFCRLFSVMEEHMQR